MRYLNTYALYRRAEGETLRQLADRILEAKAVPFFCDPLRVDEDDLHLGYGIRRADLVIADDFAISTFVVVTGPTTGGVVRCETWTPETNATWIKAA